MAARFHDSTTRRSCGCRSLLSRKTVFVVVSLVLALLVSLEFWEAGQLITKSEPGTTPLLPRLKRNETTTTTTTSKMRSISNKTTTKTIHTKASSAVAEEARRVIVSIPPSRMKVHYHEMWNHTTSTIRVPEEYKNPFDAWVVVDETHDDGTTTTRRRRPKTSLEILDEVLNGPKYRSEFEKVDAYMAEQPLLRNKKKKKKNANATAAASSLPSSPKPDIPKCLLPDVEATRELAQTVVQKRRRQKTRRQKQQQKQQRRQKSLLGNDKNKNFVLPLPILNVGYPKVGSNTLKDYFSCIGLRANHAQQGQLMFDNLFRRKPIFRASRFKASKHDKTGDNYDAYTQLDNNYDTGYYPQISLLDELHEIHPSSTLVMNFRPIPDWIRSAAAWREMALRFAFFDVPGLVHTPDHRKRLEEWRRIKKKSLNANLAAHPLRRKIGDSLTHAQLARWWCGHVLHLREYVREYPGHSLIELDLYDTAGTVDLLHDLFRADTEEKEDEDPTTNNGTTNSTQSCWGHSNSNTNIHQPNPTS